MQNFSTLFYPSSVALVNAKDIASNITVNVVNGVEITDLSAKALDAYDVTLAYQSVSSTYLTAVPSNLSLTSVNATVILSGGVDLKNIFLTSETDSQTLTYTSSSYNLSISNGNNVNLSSIFVSPNVDTIFKTVSAIALSGVFYGDGSNLIGASLPGQQQINTTVQTNSAGWNTAYNVATAYNSISSTFATNTTVNSVSSLLTPLTLTNTLTGQLVTNTNFTNYQTSVAAAAATLLPTTTYQNASGSFATNTLLQSTSALLTPLTTTRTLTGQLVLNTDFDIYKTNVAFATGTLLPTTTYQSASGSFATNTLLQSTSALLTPLTLTNTLTGELVLNTDFSDYRTSVAASTATLLPTTTYQNASGQFATNTALEAASSVLLPITVYQSTSGQFALNNIYQDLTGNWQNAYNTGTVYQSNSASYATTSYVNSNFLALSGGTITGNLSVLGDITYMDTAVQVTSAMFIDTDSAETALRITQKGSGDVIRVEDSANPDSTPFIVKSDGLVGIGTDNPNSALTVVGNISATGGGAFSTLSATVNGLATTPTQGITLRNSTAAANGAQQVSPFLSLAGQGWNTTSSISQEVEFGWHVLPVQANPVISELRLRHRVASGSWTTVAKFFSGNNTSETTILELNGAFGNTIFRRGGSNDLGIDQNLRVGGGWFRLDSSGGSIVFLHTDGSNIFGQRNGTAAQEYRLYGTYTSSTNFERLSLKYNNTVGVSAFQIGTEKGSGGGTARPLEFQTDGTTRMTIGSAGTLTVNGSISATGFVSASAANISGDVIANRIQATVKNFYIDHPTKPDKHLVYSSLETPYNGVQLTGEAELVHGECIVQLPDYLHGLIHANNVHIQLTNYKHSKVLYVDSIDIKNNKFVVKCDSWTSKFKTLKFFWLLNGVRKDIELLQTEV